MTIQPVITRKVINPQTATGRGAAIVRATKMRYSDSSGSARWGSVIQEYASEYSALYPERELTAIDFEPPVELSDGKQVWTAPSREEFVEYLNGSSGSS